jgi:acetyl-CoA synthetase
VVGQSRCPIVDTFWQTETGGHMITPLPGATPLVPGSCTLPLPGIMAAIVDETGHDVPNGQGGLLVVKRPWPSMIRTIWGDPERFKKSYYPADLGGKLYLAGDGSVRDKETGYFTIMGRIDDVLNVSGHRMGTMEIESALVANPMVAEAAVVGRPDDMTGEAVCAFVVLKQARPSGEEGLRIAKELRDWVAKEIGPISFATHSRSSLAIFSASAPSGRACFSTTTAHTASPVMSSGRPTTAASATCGFATSADSISIVPRRWPETFSTSSMRPMIQK